jgi:hypothetical protein
MPAAFAGSHQAGRLNPCRRALPATRALPAAVRGPVLFVALARLAATLAAPVMVGTRNGPAQIGLVRCVEGLGS